jgi:starch phosphorylase
MEYFIQHQVYEFFIQFLMGRFLTNALLHLEIIFKDSLEELDIKLGQLYNEEYDAGLGSGGVGRLLWFY